MTAKEKLIERYPYAHVYWYPALNLYGNNTKVWVASIGDNQFLGDTESKACKTALAKMPVDNLTPTP